MSVNNTSLPSYAIIVFLAEIPDFVRCGKLTPGQTVRVTGVLNGDMRSLTDRGYSVGLDLSSIVGSQFRASPGELVQVIGTLCQQQASGYSNFHNTLSSTAFSINATIIRSVPDLDIPLYEQAVGKMRKYLESTHCA